MVKSCVCLRGFDALSVVARMRSHIPSWARESVTSMRAAVVWILVSVVFIIMNDILYE